MVSKELANYIKEQRLKGYSDNVLRTVLLNAGYDKPVIEEALASEQAMPPSAIQPSATISPITPEQPLVAAPDQKPRVIPESADRLNRRNAKNAAKKQGIVIAFVIILAGIATALVYFKIHMNQAPSANTGLASQPGATPTATSTQPVQVNAATATTTVTSTTAAATSNGPTETASTTQQQDAQRISDIQQVQRDLELYYDQNGYYPQASTWSTMSADLIGANVGITSVPNDPVAGKTYYYQDFSNGEIYVMGAKLANNNAIFSSMSSVPDIPAGMSSCTAASLEYCVSE